MRRREFIAGLGAAAWPLVARGQQGERMRRIGFITALDENDPALKIQYSQFTRALADLGWTDGRNVRMDLRWGGGDNNRIRTLAQELVGLKPDIILAIGSPAVALQQETRTIPIVFTNVGDPVANGLVASLDRPGGNITGFASLEATLGGKWLELLSEIAPGLKRVAIMFDPDLPSLSVYMPSIESKRPLSPLGASREAALLSCRGGSQSRIACRSYRRFSAPPGDRDRWVGQHSRGPCRQGCDELLLPDNATAKVLSRYITARSASPESGCATACGLGIERCASFIQSFSLSSNPNGL
jgi:hypothetical protein